MLNLDKKIISSLIFALVFQWCFPHISLAYAGELDNKEFSVLAMANLEEPILSDPAVNREEFRLPEAQEVAPAKSMTITVTAYSSEVDQCDGSPFVTANGKRVRDGIVAANFLPFGTKLRIPALFGDKIFTVEDRMNARYHERMDIWMETYEAARQFGARRLEIEIFSGGP